MDDVSHFMRECLPTGHHTQDHRFGYPPPRRFPPVVEHRASSTISGGDTAVQLPANLPAVLVERVEGSREGPG